jgi:putative hydrolase of the HAD superfamily
MKYKAVIFDLFGTLVENFTVTEYQKVLTDMAGILKVPRQEFSKLWRDYFPERVNGTHRTHQISIDYICKELGVKVNGDQIEKAADLRLEYTAKALKPREDAIPTIKKLKSMGFKVGLISDCSPETPAVWPRTVFASVFDVTIFSCVAGVKKPDPSIYRMATEKLNVKPQECLYIGDGSSNELTGALNFGMHPVLISVIHESSDAHYVDREQNWQGQKISSLKEVLNLVRQRVVYH